MPPSDQGTEKDLTIAPPETLRQRVATGAQFETQLTEVRRFIHVEEAWKKFGVRGEGLVAAVFDTGIFAAHVDFDEGKRVLGQLNLTADNQGVREDASDGNGHGTNVAGIIGAGSLNMGIAPRVGLVAVKVVQNVGGGSFDNFLEGLKWIDTGAGQKLQVSVVNISLSAAVNRKNDSDFARLEIKKVIASLRAKGVAIVVSAGNDYFSAADFGMAFPAIYPDTVSVGAVYDADGGAVGYDSGARANSRTAGQIAPFSQRLPESVGGRFRTDVFAPGAPITSTGLKDPKTGISTQSGTSQAAPVTSGIIVLVQQLYQKKFAGKLPKVDDVERWLRAGSLEEVDGDNEDDNVKHPTPASKYPRVDALKTLEAVATELGLNP
jgi:subtilisin family serine protease